MYIQTNKQVDMVLTIGEESIQYIHIQNFEDVSKMKKEDIFKPIFDKNTSQVIKHIEIGEKVTLDFGGNPPDKISIKDILLKSNGDFLFDEKFTKEVPFTREKNKYYFTVEQNYSSGFVQTQGQKTITRGYVIDSYWKNVKHSYAFVIETDPIVYLEWQKGNQSEIIKIEG